MNTLYTLTTTGALPEGPLSLWYMLPLDQEANYKGTFILMDNGGAMAPKLIPVTLTPVPQADAVPLLTDLYRLLVHEFAASPDSGEVVSADVRPLFNRLCDSLADAQRAALSAPGAGWTTALPNECGYYWWKKDAETTTRVLKIWNSSDGYFPIEGWYTNETKTVKEIGGWWQKLNEPLPPSRHPLSRKRHELTRNFKRCTTLNSRQKPVASNRTYRGQRNPRRICGGLSRSGYYSRGSPRIQRPWKHKTSKSFFGEPGKPPHR